MSSGSIDVVAAGNDSQQTTVDGTERPSPTAHATANPLRPKDAKKFIGYVRQDDFLLPFLTVRETLNFAAALRLPKTVPAATRNAIVEQTMFELGLADAADVVVGGPFRKGISGGEKRRLSIGCTLVQMPSVLVLDEPTTGLDSFTAFQILETLKKLAQRGRTVIVTLHGPRSDAFPLVRPLFSISTSTGLPRPEAVSHVVRPTLAPLARQCDLPRRRRRDPALLRRAGVRCTGRVESARLCHRHQQHRQPVVGSRARVEGKGRPARRLVAGEGGCDGFGSARSTHSERERVARRRRRKEWLGSASRNSDRRRLARNN
jgi:ABC-type lipoprotein export system ATPase subunit